ncbi:PREDICTED: uncharacterized protein LOC109214652 [Nicotiana attenuata]|uniref:uncharacterized protein LOC109214652 n=1 Tax=Nicotiana attenuata TaxID=49451 RepID=UPI000904E042|nr:PREDICTED: uncharacterized protein LOC109214652 [Nicotiana attenuata]
MKFPVGFTPPSPNHVCKLKKSIYELRQASRQWYSKLTTALNFKGYTHSLNDYSLFFKETDSSISIVAVYVDDILLTGNDTKELTALKEFLHQEFRIKDLGHLHYFLGMEVLRESHRIDSLHKSPVSCPLDPSARLLAQTGDSIPDSTLYRHLLGKLNYLTHTRSDISYIVQHLSQYMQDSRQPHHNVALCVLRYLLKDPGLGLFMSSSPSYQLPAFCDSDWSTCPNSRKSVSGFYISLGSCRVLWK